MTTPAAPSAPAKPAAGSPAKPASTPATPKPGATSGSGDKGAGTATGGSWDKAGEATARSGEGTARNDHWQAARNVHGDHIAGDKVKGNKYEMWVGDRRVPLRELSIELADPVRYAFAKPDDWPGVREAFRRSRSAVVRGRAGQGKDACAIQLLTGETDVIYQIDPAVDVAGLADSVAEQLEMLPEERRIGFLLCQPADAGKLRGFTFYTLETVLAARDARLVITLPPGAQPADDLDRFVIDLDVRPVDRWRIVTSHLAWRCDEVLAPKLVANPQVRELADELTHEGMSCHAAAELAWIISSECSDDGRINVPRVRERHERRQDESFELWFDSLRDVEERTFAIALAALDGLPYEEVAEAARRLRRRLDTSHRLALAEGKDRSELWAVDHDRFRTSTTRLLQTVRAERSAEVYRYAYGQVPVQTVKYKDRTYPRKVIERIWRGYQIQPTLLEWLAEIVHSASEPVRFFAASTLGVLARFSFDYLCNSVLDGWADSEDYRLREAVAYALREPANDEALASSVTAIVVGWYQNRGRPNAQATAARAYGVGVGGLDRDAAVERLGRLATVDELQVAIAIGDALADLILQAPREAAPVACRALLSWVTDRQRRRSAQLAFLIVADTIITWQERDDGGEATRWPTLLHLASSEDSIRGPLFLLWRRVINEAVLSEETHGVLSFWAGLAENDPPQLDALTRLIREVGTRPEPDRRIQTIVLGLAKDWIKPENLMPLPRAHDAVVAQFAAGHPRS